MAIHFSLVSLGCAKNRVDSEVMIGLLQQSGLEYTIEENNAEVIIVNTCGFITPAKEESINTILELAQYKQQGKCRALLVGGCLSKGHGQELQKELPEVDGFFGPGEVPDIAGIVQEVLSGVRVSRVSNTEFIYDHSTPRILTTPHHYAYIKLADGCDNRCSYCAIPNLRGGYRSRPEESVVEEVKSLAGQGIQEFLLIAQDTTRYGLDRYEEFRLPKLLDRLAVMETVKWLRLLYCYPSSFNQELIETMARWQSICKYVDLPIQHADDHILKTMNRRGSSQEIIQLIDNLRQAMPGIALRTSFIVGLPGETEERFQRLLDFMQEIKFDRAGVFVYSQEQGTPAAEFSGQVPDETKQERYHRAMQFQQTISREINQRFIGEVMEVLIEEEMEEGRYIGRSQREAPEVDGHIEFTGGKFHPGQWVRVKITDAGDYDLIGVACNEPA